MDKTLNLQKLYFKDTSFVSLMKERIYNVLLIASKYDAFMLEEDGRIDEQIFNEYTALNLRYPPRFTIASERKEVKELIQTRHYDLIIVMPTSDNSQILEMANELKLSYSDIPIVVLTTLSRRIFKRVFSEGDFSHVDYVFSWLGNSDLLLAIVKLLEDKLNVDDDVASVGVQVILFVEDSIHFYSSILPYLYKHVFTQSLSFMTEALNAHQQMLRMRGRPKILLARNYEEALFLYKKYQKNMLGVITDVRFPKAGQINPTAGLELSQQIRKMDPFVPIIVESSEPKGVCEQTDKLCAIFLDKTDKSFHKQFKDAITHHFKFGDLVFVNPQTREPLITIRNLQDLQKHIFDVPSNSLFYHLAQNDLSRWLYSRAMFPLAEYLRYIIIKDINDIDRARQVVFDAIVTYRKIKNKGIVAVFQSDRFDEYSNFARIGEDSMGGKGRGLAFLNAVSKRNPALYDFETTQITVPKTVVLCTDMFDEFMESNSLYGIALSEGVSDESILDAFLQARLPRKIMKDLYAFLGVIQNPIAVRSSSLLEDSHYQPFAGIYSTYMVPYVTESRTTTLRMVCDAIKAVYASVFYADSKAYMKATKNLIDEEKMAVVLQEVCGKLHGNRFYPSFSGVARSLNYYPIGEEKPEEGVVNVALGLGKYIVDGGQTLRFCPAYPNKVLQTSTMEFALSETQNYFYCLDVAQKSFTPKVDDGDNLQKIHIREAEADGTLRWLASTFDPIDQIIREGIYPDGRKLITFVNILEHQSFPLAEILKNVLSVGEKEMGCAVEIEFAVNLDYEEKEQHTFYLLQIRPIVGINETLNEDLSVIEKETTLLTSTNALGNGVINDVYDVVYVKKGAFNPSKNMLIAYDIEKINKQLVAEEKPYVLVGPGRWGSSDHWLGIPVRWPHISGARVIVEAGETSYHIDPSQGTHFFQNLTSFGVCYFTVAQNENDYFDNEYLDQQEAIHETEYIRHVRFSSPLLVKVDGRKNRGVVLKVES
jgi:CheY-like chemotaxis protein